MIDTTIKNMVVQRYYILKNLHIMMPILTTTPEGFLLSVDGTKYVLEWVGEMLKVTGPNVCYYLVETARGLEQANCALSTFTLLVGN